MSTSLDAYISDIYSYPDVLSKTLNEARSEEFGLIIFNVSNFTGLEKDEKPDKSKLAHIKKLVERMYPPSSLYKGEAIGVEVEHVHMSLVHIRLTIVAAKKRKK